MDPEKKAAHLLLHMSDVALTVCVTAGEDVIGNLYRLEQMLRIPRKCFAPDAIGSIFQDVVTLMYFRRADPEIDANLVDFDALRQKAET